MSAIAKPAVAIVASLLAATLLPAHADERALLNHCKALIAQAPPSQGAGGKPEDAELGRCRQIIREWTLRDSRMSVDENGRPLR
jgi:hypothetical protein